MEDTGASRDTAMHTEWGPEDPPLNTASVGRGAHRICGGRKAAFGEAFQEVTGYGLSLPALTWVRWFYISFHTDSGRATFLHFYISPGLHENTAAMRKRVFFSFPFLFRPHVNTHTARTFSR